MFFFAAHVRAASLLLLVSYMHQAGVRRRVAVLVCDSQPRGCSVANSHVCFQCTFLFFFRFLWSGENLNNDGENFDSLRVR